MVMSGSPDDPRDNVGEQAEVLDWSYQNKAEALLRKGRLSIVLCGPFRAITCRLIFVPIQGLVF